MANKYSNYTPDRLEEHFSNYLVDSWSYSGLACFARNEKAFEMQYIYREKDRRSIASIVGNAYHEALKQFFLSFDTNREPVVVDLLAIAYAYIDNVPANEWSLTDKFPTVEQCIYEANRRVVTLLTSFCAEISEYLEDVACVLDVETYYDEWLVINGVDIPLPCHAVIDLSVELKDGRIVIIDHKSKSSYTEEKEIALVHGQQGITYVKEWEAAHEGKDPANPNPYVSEVWFIENKITMNKDKSPQMRRHVISMDPDNRRLFEALLYEPLRRMLEAVSNPDYIYMINASDKFTDMALLYDFWARTQISEIGDFEYVPAEKRDLLEKRQRKIKDSSVASVAPNVIAAFRKNAASFITLDYSHSDMKTEEKIEHVLRTFNIKVQVAHKIEGFSCDTYLCEVAPGTELLSIFRHALDIANALDVPRVRIQGEPLVVYEGKSYLGIEVNKKRTETLLWDKKYYEGGLRIPLGVDNYRRTIVWDLNNNTTPHLLVCGATGSGKSVELFNILYYAIEAGVKDITILDPKCEFAFAELPEFVKVVTEISDIEKELHDMVDDMNTRIKDRLKHLSLVIFDEFADAADQARSGKELDIKEEQEVGRYANGEPMRKVVVVGREKSLIENFKMLLQKGRSCGFRFVAATQRASSKVIPGDIKVNLPVQVCFRVPKGLDSKVVLDVEGAEALAGAGDGLIHSPEYNDGLVRFQGFYHP